MEIVNSNGQITKWDKENIINKLIEESKFACKFNLELIPFDREFALEIAQEIEDIIFKIDLERISGSLIRELVNLTLVRCGYSDYARFMKRVGLPLVDSYEIDVGGEGAGNANLQPTPETAHKLKADWVSKEEALLLLPEHLSNLHLDSNLHIHDLEYFTTRPFCCDHDLRYFFYYGLRADGTGEASSVATAAKSGEVAVLHAAKILASAQTNAAGGEGFFNFLVFLSPYFKNYTYKRIEQCLQMFIYEMTQMYAARGSQAVFSSFQLQPGVPKMWRDIPAVYHGKISNTETYGDFEKEVRLAFKATMKLITEGDAIGKPFNYPKPEISIEKEFIDHLDEQIEDWPTYRELYLDAFKAVAKNGTPYFDNNLPSYRNAGEGISCVQCCSYIFSSDPKTDINFKRKYEFIDGHHMSMGACQVITINFPRLAYQSNGDYDVFIRLAKERMNACVDIFKIKRNWIQVVRDKGRLPFLQQTPPDPHDKNKKAPELYDFDELVYCIGVIGINEVVQILLGEQLHESDDAVKLGLKIVYTLNKYSEELSKERGIKLAFSRTPAETTAERFAIADLKKYPDKAKQYIKGDMNFAMEHLKEKSLPIYYTNGTMVTPASGLPLTKKIEIESKFFPVLQGGNICHIWLNDQEPDPEALMDFTLNVCKNTNLGYFTFTKDYHICK